MTILVSNSNLYTSVFQPMGRSPLGVREHINGEAQVVISK